MLISNLTKKTKPQETWAKIDKSSVFEKHKTSPRRCCFQSHSGLQDKKKNGTRSFSVKFFETVVPIFQKQTGLFLRESLEFKNFFMVINDKCDYDVIKKWEDQCGGLIFLRDCLSLSVALDFNFTESEDGGGRRYTSIGTLEHDAKTKQNHSAIVALAKHASEKIRALPYYSDADVLCAIPPSPDKDFDLPRRVVSEASKSLKKDDISSFISFEEIKPELKSISFDDKWDALSNANLTISDPSQVLGKRVILVDDKYQSGITMQYVAMKLQEAGAKAIYGLSLVKTWRDTDNGR